MEPFINIKKHQTEILCAYILPKKNYSLDTDEINFTFIYLKTYFYLLRIHKTNLTSKQEHRIFEKKTTHSFRFFFETNIVSMLKNKLFMDFLVYFF